jgi:4'-phosphopantetheinyl transferase
MVMNMAWAPGPAAPTLGDGEAHVWRTSLDAVPGSQARRLEAFLSVDEVRHGNGFAFPSDRRRFIVARAVLRSLLGRYLDLPPAAIELAVTPTGKPELGVALGHALQFNVSHSDGVALYAIGRGLELGVDVERVRPAVLSELLAARVLPIEATRHVDTLVPAERADAAFAAWTRREAYAKATGLGLAELDRSAAPPSEWTLHEVPMEAGWKAALAAAGPVTRVRYWTLEVNAISAR